MRIHVTGNAGAGKTTLGSRIAEEFNLPCYGLDRIVWRPDWQKTPADERDRLEAELIARPDWVIEGVSHMVRDAADMTVFLDVPRHRCLRRSFLRSLRFLFSGRPELPDNCPEYKILPRLIPIIWRFQSRVRPVIMQDIVSGKNIICVSNASEINWGDLRRRMQDE